MPNKQGNEKKEGRSVDFLNVFFPPLRHFEKKTTQWEDWNLIESTINCLHKVLKSETVSDHAGWVWHILDCARILNVHLYDV